MTQAARRRWLRQGIGLAVMLTSVRGAWAQADWRRIAVPYVTPRQFVAGALQGHALPRARSALEAAEELVAALQQRVDEPATPADAARRAWTDAVLRWSALNAVSIGPLLARRSARQIDFAPTRPEQVLRAIDRLASEPGLGGDRVGSAAKGFGAIEWLLWNAQAPADGAALRYALFAAQAIVQELGAVVEALQSSDVAAVGEDELVAAFTEVLNQWLGGIESLRLAVMAQAGGTRGAASRGRPWSGVGPAELAARWGALQALTVYRSAGAPPPVETVLRGRGLNPLADRLVAAAAAVRTPTGAAPLARLKRTVEAEVMPALNVRVGFSDADGD